MVVSGPANGAGLWDGQEAAAAQREAGPSGNHPAEAGQDRQASSGAAAGSGPVSDQAVLAARKALNAKGGTAQLAEVSHPGQLRSGPVILQASCLCLIACMNSEPFRGLCIRRWLPVLSVASQAGCLVLFLM